MKSDDIGDLHARFTQQARWTAALRSTALALPAARAARRILEVGSGTGAITLDLHRHSPARIVGIDLAHASNRFASHTDPATRFATGRGEQLPFPSGAFDLACCHFLLLWVDDPAAILSEMARVTAPGGLVLCLAEPDYGGRIEHPEALVELGTAQEAGLRREGADPCVGRRLRALLHQAGLTSVTVGVLGGEWAADAPGQPEDLDLEWRTLVGDVAGALSHRTMDRLHSALAAAQAERSHILFIPTFYGWGSRRS